MLCRLAVGTLLAMTLLFVTPERASATVPVLDLDAIGPGSARVPVAFLSDGMQPRSIDEVAGPLASNAFEPTPDLASVPFVSGWLRFSLRSRSVTTPWILVLDPSFDEADLYVNDGRGGFELTRFGMLVPFDKRSFRELSIPAEVGKLGSWWSCRGAAPRVRKAGLPLSPGSVSIFS